MGTRYFPLGGLTDRKDRSVPFRSLCYTRESQIRNTIVTPLGIHAVVSGVVWCDSRDRSPRGEAHMPRKSLPDRIEPDPDASLSNLTQAEREIIEVLPDLWEKHDTIPEMADETDWSASKVGQVWREFYRPAKEEAPTAHAETEAPQSGEAGSDKQADEIKIQTPEGTFSVPDDPEEREAFWSFVKSHA